MVFLCIFCIEKKALLITTLVKKRSYFVSFICVCINYFTQWTCLINKLIEGHVFIHSMKKWSKLVLVETVYKIVNSKALGIRAHFDQHDIDIFTAIPTGNESKHRKKWELKIWCHKPGCLPNDNIIFVNCVSQGSVFDGITISHHNTSFAFKAEEKNKRRVWYN